MMYAMLQQQLSLSWWSVLGLLKLSNAKNLSLSSSQSVWTNYSSLPTKNLRKYPLQKLKSEPQVNKRPLLFQPQIQLSEAIHN